MASAVGPESCRMVCSQCHLEVMTKTEPKSTTRTHLIALLLCLLGCWPCVCCLYCTECARNLDHYCPSCNNFMGTYER
ncbi:hypothetical protein KR222_011753 [Zaprionus bogoriensis]|nr:hypothetical protein KR222_011753 [Zaprionus bogoriensis]